MPYNGVCVCVCERECVLREKKKNKAREAEIVNNDVVY